MSDDYETILYEVEDPVALITLNRTSRMNAWNMTMARELRDAVRRAGEDRRVVGVVITGAGRAFCAGGDMKDLKLDDLRVPAPAEGAEGTPTAVPTDPVGPLGYLMDLPKPVIAAVNGPAIGMGAVLALWADLRFMGEEAMFGMGFSERGTVAESGSSCLLTRLIGPSAAIDLLVSSRRITAEESLALGLVNRVVPAAALVDSAREYVAALARTCSPASMATIKQQVYSELPDDLGKSVRTSRRLLAEAVDGPDIKEGWQSFLEKRAPRFARIGSA